MLTIRVALPLLRIAFGPFWYMSTSATRSPCPCAHISRRSAKSRSGSCSKDPWMRRASCLDWHICPAQISSSKDGWQNCASRPLSPCNWCRHSHRYGQPRARHSQSGPSKRAVQPFLLPNRANVQAAQKQGLDGRFDLAEFHQKKMWAGGFGVWVPPAWWEQALVAPHRR